jgi:hypothetical protein
MVETLVRVEFIEDVLRVLIGVLVPIVPAYVLYKSLPNKTVVKGPFQGLNVQLSGSFGGYFLIVLIVFFCPHIWQEEPKFELWEIKGRVQCRDCVYGQEIDRLSISLNPPNVTLLDTGEFRAQIARAPGQTGQLSFPILVVQHPDFQTVTIDLNEQAAGYGQQALRLKRDQAARTITVEDSLVLQKKSLYASIASATPEAGVANAEVLP